jgi:hypothetical protein
MTIIEDGIIIIILGVSRIKEGETRRVAEAGIKTFRQKDTKIIIRKTEGKRRIRGKLGRRAYISRSRLDGRVEGESSSAPQAIQREALR